MKKYNFSSYFSQEDRLINHLVLHSIDVPNPGLFHGQMGICLVLAVYGKKKKDKQIKKISELLLERISSMLTENDNMSFAFGLSGIGWGIEYLIQNKLMTGDSLEICESIDKKLQKLDLAKMDNLSLETGIEGLLHYILIHIKGTVSEGHPFTKDFMDLLYVRLCGLLKSTVQRSITLDLLSQNFINIYNGLSWQYHPNLNDFIKTKHRHSKRILGLREGVAGRFYKEHIATP